MDDIIAAIGNWLTETHEGKRQAVTNLEWLFWIAAGDHRRNRREGLCFET